MNTIITDLVKALEIGRNYVSNIIKNADGMKYEVQQSDIDSLSTIDAALTRAERLDPDRAEVKFFYSSLRDLTHCTILFDNDVEVLCIPLLPLPNADEHEISMTTNDDTPKPKLTFEQMDDLMKPYLRYVDQVIVHRGTATRYRVVHLEFIESTMELHFSYYPLGNCYIVFSRPITELTHERYEFPDDSKPNEPPPPPPDIRGTSFKDGWPRRGTKE